MRSGEHKSCCHAAHLVDAFLSLRRFQGAPSDRDVNCPIRKGLNASRRAQAWQHFDFEVSIQLLETVAERARGRQSNSGPANPDSLSGMSRDARQ